MFPIYFKKKTNDQIVRSSNEKIRSLVNQYFTNYPEFSVFAQACGAYALACKLCEQLEIDVLEIEKPEVYLDYLRKEKYAKGSLLNQVEIIDASNKLFSQKGGKNE